MFEFYKIELPFYPWNDVSIGEESPKWAQKRNVQKTWSCIDSFQCVTSGKLFPALEPLLPCKVWPTNTHLIGMWWWLKETTNAWHRMNPEQISVFPLCFSKLYSNISHCTRGKKKNLSNTLQPFVWIRVYFNKWYGTSQDIPFLQPFLIRH